MASKVKQHELKIYPSEYLTDTPDGGGLRVGTPLTGIENELFPPVSDIDNTRGDFGMRLVYAGIDRADDEPLFGGHFIISKPPATPNVSFLAFKAAYNGELRKDAVKRVESYNIKTIPSRLTLVATQTQGSKVVQAYQLLSDPLVSIGEVFCLDQNKAGHPTAEQYIKVLSVDNEEREFFNNVTNTYFKRRVVTLGVSSPLVQNFVGVDVVTEAFQSPPCTIRETAVADAGQYYGVKKLKNPTAAGDYQVSVEGIFEKLAPTNQVESPLTDLHAGEQARQHLAVGGFIESWHTASIGENTTYKYATAIAPGSFVQYSRYGGVISHDDGNGQIVRNGGRVGRIDYDLGVVVFERYLDGQGGYVAKKNKYRRRIDVVQISDTAAIAVSISNQAFNYVLTIDPAPTPGSLIVSYRSQGNWYDLKADLNGVLAGSSSDYGTGQIITATNTVAVTLGALPDVGSEIIYSWGSRATYTDRSDLNIPAAKTTLSLANAPLIPGTVNITYPTGATTATATDNGDGTTSSVDFSIDYANAEISVNALYASGAQYSVTYNHGTPLSKEFVAPLRNTSGGLTLDLEQTNITPHTVKMVWNVDILPYDYISTTPAEQRIFLPPPVDPYITVYDDGSGNLKDAEGVSYGTVNYATGIVDFNPDTTINIPVARYSVAHLGYADGGLSTPVYRNLFTHWQYIPAGAQMPIGPTGKVSTYFSSATAANAVTETIDAPAPSIDLTPNLIENIVPNSVVFTLSGNTYFDKDGRLFYKHNISDGTNIQAGTIDYSSGEVTLSAWDAGANAVALIALLTTQDKNPVDEVTFRIPSSPILPQSFQLRGTNLQGGQINVIADANGVISGADIKGKINYETGVVRCRFGRWIPAAGNESEIFYDAAAIKDGKIFKPVPVFAHTLKYNAVAYTYIPLDTDIIGIDAARLPIDGRVPIYRVGDVIVIADRREYNMGSAFTSNQVVTLPHNDLTTICITDSDGKHLDAALYSIDLAAGTITFADNLSLAAYHLPLKACYSREERKAITRVDISGTLSMTESLQRSYDPDHTYVSSAMLGGDLQVRATKPFTQQTWSNIWSDERNTAAILSKVNTKDYPIVLTDDGAITDRWAIVFRSATAFDLYSETLGLIARTDILQDLAPLNPASNKPYFTLPHEAFGISGVTAWAAGNVIRFNTQGATIMPWIIRAVQPSSYTQTDSDGFTMCLRGNTVEE